MKWLIVIGALLQISLYGNDVVLGIIATVIIACIFVIVRIKKTQKQRQAESFEKAVGAAECIIRYGYQKAMNEFN